MRAIGNVDVEAIELRCRGKSARKVEEPYSVRIRGVRAMDLLDNKKGVLL